MHTDLPLQIYCAMWSLKWLKIIAFRIYRNDLQWLLLEESKSGAINRSVRSNQSPKQKIKILSVRSVTSDQKSKHWNKNIYWNFNWFDSTAQIEIWNSRFYWICVISRSDMSASKCKHLVEFSKLYWQRFTLNFRSFRINESNEEKNSRTVFHFTFLFLSKTLPNSTTKTKKKQLRNESFVKIIFVLLNKLSCSGSALETRAAQQTNSIFRRRKNALKKSLLAQINRNYWELLLV